MSVISVNQVSANGRIDDQGHREWLVRYKVRTDNRSTGPVEVLTDVLSPAYASTYSFGLEADAGAYRTRSECELVSEDDSGKLWDMRLSFASRPVVRPDTALFGGGNPTNDPTTFTRISGGFVPFTQAAARDFDGDPIVNAVGDPFLGLSIERHRPTLKIEKTYTRTDFITLYPTLCVDVSVGKLNSGTFFNAGSRRWKISSSPWQEVYYGETKYYQIDFSFEYDVSEHALEPANRGPRYKSGTQYLRFADDKGLDWGGDGLGPLNVDGTKRASGSTPAVIYFDGSGSGAGDPFQIYNVRNFGAAPYSLPTGL